VLGIRASLLQPMRQGRFAALADPMDAGKGVTGAGVESNPECGFQMVHHIEEDGFLESSEPK
jgi:hypothetical protein